MQPSPSLLPLPEDVDIIAELFSCMRLMKVHACERDGCRFYLAQREVLCIKDNQPNLYRGSHFMLIFSARLAEGQLLLEADNETVDRAFDRRVAEWRRSHYCNGCQNCTAKGGANGTNALEPVIQAAELSHTA